MLKLKKCHALAVAKIIVRTTNTKPIPMPDLASKLKAIQERDEIKPTNILIAEPLIKREIIRVSGEEAGPFLQGLITNDIKHLEDNSQRKAMYAMFLNKSGKVLYDSIIYNTVNKGTFLLEVDSAISSELRRTLRIYRVRRKIDIDVVDDQYKPWVIFNPLSLQNGRNIRAERLKELGACNDPRTPHLGLRILANPSLDFENLASICERLENNIRVHAASVLNNYRTHRYTVGVGEGITDLPPGKANPLESNADFLHGVSFHKGCYIGQELTARTHHTGIIRKRLMPLRLSKSNAHIEAAPVTTIAGINLGKIMGVSGERALGLLRVEKVLAVPNHELIVDENPVYVEKPSWWPQELPKRFDLNKLEAQKNV